MKDIIFIVESPLLERDIRRYEINDIRNKGINVNVCDLSPILQPYAFLNITKGKCDYQKENILTIKSWVKFENFIKQNANNRYVVKLGNGPYTHNLYKLFYKYDIIYCLLLPENVPSIGCNQRKNHIHNYIKKLSNKPFQALKGSLYKRFFSYYSIQAPKIVLYSGKQDKNLENILSNYKITKETSYESVASVSLIECENSQKRERIFKDNYLLFIDQGLPVHPDIISNDIKIPFREYYDTVNSFLKKVSHQMGVKVVVALHPRVDYESIPFDADFSCISENTVDLIKDSSLVIYHFSEAFNYVAYFKKPVLIVTLYCLEKNFGYAIRTKASIIGANVLNLSENLNSDCLSEYIMKDIEAMSEYTKRYLPSQYDNNCIATALEKFASNDKW